MTAHWKSARLGCALAAAALAACRGGGENTTDTLDGATPPAEVTPARTASPEAAAVKRRPLPREGSTIARSAAGDVLYIADEDSGVLHQVALPVDVKKASHAYPMPGQPAQVLALPDGILVTIRSAGAAPPGKGERPAPTPAPPPAPAPTPSSAPSADPSASAAPAAPPPSSGKVTAGEGLAVPSATGPGLLLILRPDPAKGLIETARIELPQDAWGVAVTPDASLALVTSAWTHQVSAIDLASRKVRWTVSVAREPRAVIVRADGKAAYVTHLVGAAITRIDDLQGPPKVHAVAVPPAPLRTPPGQKLGASLAYAATLSPDGRRLFLPRHALGALGAKAWFGAAAVDVLLTADDTALAPFRKDQRIGTVKFSEDDDPTAPGTMPSADPTPFAQPRAVVYRASRDTLLVLGEGSDNLVELDARAVDPTLHVVAKHDLVQEREHTGRVARSCGAPTGITLSDDERTAWIHCRSTDDLLVYDLDRDPTDTHPRPLVTLSDYLLADAYLGRRLFYNATDRVVSGGLGCAGCHPEGRDDGHVWHETEAVAADHGSHHHTFMSSPDSLGSLLKKPEDVGVARQTPQLAGRVTAEGPYGWHGESPTLIARLVAGFSLHRWDEPSGYGGDKEVRALAAAVATYLRRGLVPPPHEDRELSAKEKRGREVFYGDESLCWACHKAEPEYTDRAPHPVFEGLEVPDGFAGDPEKGFKTPSLRFVGGTPPYGHDGRFATLSAMIEQGGDRMGKTSHLSAADKAALVAFLETL